MTSSNNNVKPSWLRISDLHVFPEADITLILEDYSRLANVISPQFLVITGDYRHLGRKTDFSLAKEYLVLL